MSEHLRIKEIIINPKAAVPLLLSALAIAGCGNTRSADNEPIGMCGSHDYSKPADPLKPNQTKAQVIAAAEQDAVTLHSRAVSVGGDIDLPRYGNNGSGNVIEVTASSDELRLNFDRTPFFGGPRVDHIDFTIKGNSTDISEGAVLCYDTSSQQIVTNGTFQTLQDYVHETANLDQ